MRRISFAFLAAAFILSTLVRGADQTWTGLSTVDGKWSTAANWSGGAPPGDILSTASPDKATFNAPIANGWGTAATPIVIDSLTQNLGGIIFDTAAGDYIIGAPLGNNLLLSSGNTIQILNTFTGTNTTHTINAPLVIVGVGGNGTYALTNNSANGAGAGAGTLNFGGTISGFLADNTTTLTLSGSNTNLNTISGIIGNGGALTLALNKSGAGRWVLSAANTYTGATAIQAGTLKTGIDNALPIATSVTIGTPGGSVNLGTPGNLDITGFNQTIAGLNVIPNSTTANTITIAPIKSLNVNGSVRLGCNANGTAGDPGFTGTSTATNVVFNGGGNLVVITTPAAGNFFVGGLSIGNAVNTSTVNMNALGSFVADLGATGIFRVGERGTAGGTAASTITLAPNSGISAGTFGVGDNCGPGTGGQTSAHICRLGTGANFISANLINVGSYTYSTGIRASGLLQFNTAAGSVTIRNYAGLASLADMNLATTGSITAVQIDARALFAGHNADISLRNLNMAARTTATVPTTAPFGCDALLTFDQGTLSAVNTTLSTRSGPGIAAANSNGTITIGGGTANLGNLTMAVNIASSATANPGAANATVNVSGGTVTISSINMANATNAGITKTSNSTLNLTGGTVTLAGNITRTGGTGTENTTLTLNGATLDMGGFYVGTVGTPIGTGTGAINLQAGTLKNVLDFNDGGALTKSTAGLLVMSGANTYTGDMTLAAGTLQVGSNQALGLSGKIIFTGGILQYTPAGATGPDYSARIKSSTSAITIDTNGQLIPFAGILDNTNTAGLLLSDSNAAKGSLVLGGANAYTGTTTLAAGTLVANSATALGTSGDVTFAGGTLQYGAASGGADFSARIKNSTTAMTIDTNGQTVSFATPLENTNATGLTLLDSNATVKGSLSISGANTYQGPTAINGGTLFVNGTMTGTSAVTVGAAGTLRGKGGVINNPPATPVTIVGQIWPGVARFASGVTAGETLAVSSLALSAGSKVTILAKDTQAQSLTVIGAGAPSIPLAGASLNVYVASGTLSLTTTIFETGASGAILTSPFGAVTANGMALAAQPTVKIRYINTAGAQSTDHPAFPALGTADKVQLVVTGAVSPVTISSFNAQPRAAGIALDWTCASEFQNAGFNLYRRPQEPRPQGSGWSRINPTLILGRITNPDEKQYHFYDWTAPGAYEYRLEALSLQGQSEFYQHLAGPLALDSNTALASLQPASYDAAIASTSSSANLARIHGSAWVPRSSTLLRAEGRAHSAPGIESPAPRIETFIPAAASSSDPLSPAPSLAASPRLFSANANSRATYLNAAPRWFSANRPSAGATYSADKVVYDKPGVLLIPQAQLSRGLDIKQLSIQREGRNISALAVLPEGLLVHAPGYQDDYTDKDALFLRRIRGNTLAGQPAAASNLFNSTQPANTTSPSTVSQRFHDVYFDYDFRPYTFEPWFSSKYLTSGSVQSFTLNTPAVSTAPATLTVKLWSMSSHDSTAPDHALQLAINGQVARHSDVEPIEVETSASSLNFPSQTAATWDGGARMVELTFTLPAGLLKSGQNQIDLISPPIPGVDNQLAFVYSISAIYTRALDASAPLEIIHSAKSARLYEIQNLPSATVWIVDTRFADRAALVPVQTQRDAGGAYRARFIANSGGTGKYLVVPAGQENRPLSVSRRQVAALRWHGAYLATGPAQFGPGVQKLLAARSKEGLKSAFVDQEQLFDYYNFGRYGPSGIQKAVQAVKPQYLLLLGRTTYDYRNYEGKNVDPLCPAFLVPTSFWAQATSDSLFGDLGRGYPEVAIGRLPVNDTAELAAAVNRILSYKGAPASGVRVHAVADRADPGAGNFGEQLHAIAQSSPELSWQANTLGVTAQTSPEATAALAEAANGGADILLYAGHGNALRLGAAAPNILDVPGTQAWHGSAVFLQATCTAHWMAKNESGYRSIAIQALTQPQGGISASIGTSTYMLSEPAVAFMQQLIASVNHGTNLRWGSALMRAQQWSASQGGSYYRDLSLTEQLFGDPAMPIHAK